MCMCAYVCVVVSSKTLKNLLMPKLFYSDKKMHSNQMNRIIHTKNDLNVKPMNKKVCNRIDDNHRMCEMLPTHDIKSNPCY